MDGSAQSGCDAWGVLRAGPLRVSRVDGARSCWRTAMFIRSAWQPCGWGAARDDLLACCSRSHSLSWEAVQSLVARAWCALDDDVTASAMVCSAAVLGRVLGQLHALRMRQLDWGGGCFAAGAPIRRFWQLLRRNHTGRARPYREAAVHLHGAQRYARGLPPRRRRLGRTSGIVTGHAAAVARERILQRGTHAILASRIRQQAGAGASNGLRRRAEWAAGRAAPIGQLGAGDFAQGQPLGAWGRELRERYAGEGVCVPAGGWGTLQSATQLAEHLATAVPGSCLGALRTVVDDE